MYLYKKIRGTGNHSCTGSLEEEPFSHEIVKWRYNFFLLQVIQYEDVSSKKIQSNHNGSSRVRSKYLQVLIMCPKMYAVQHVLRRIGWYGGKPLYTLYP